jgi:hypothetical protein
VAKTRRQHVPGPLSDDVLDAGWERCRAELAAAGLPEHVEDPAVLARIAQLVRGPTQLDRLSVDRQKAGRGARPVQSRGRRADVSTARHSSPSTNVAPEEATSPSGNPAPAEATSPAENSAPEEATSPAENSAPEEAKGRDDKAAS